MWDDDFENEELERLTYDYDSTIYYSGNPKKQADSSSKSTDNTISSSYYDNFYEDDYS